MLLSVETLAAILILIGVISGFAFFVYWSETIEHLKNPTPMAILFWPAVLLKSNFREQGFEIRKKALRWLGLHVSFLLLGFFILQHSYGYL